MPVQSLPHPAFLFVLLLLPSTTLRDWERADAPNLHQVMRSGALALMNARTAERDKITFEASCYPWARGRGCGQRERYGIGIPVLPGNLAAGLRAKGVTVTTDGGILANSVVGGTLPASLGGRSKKAPTSPSPSLGKEGNVPARNFFVADLGTDPAKADSQIGEWIATVGKRHGEVMIVSPNPSPSNYEALNQLVPVLFSARRRRARSALLAIDTSCWSDREQRHRANDRRRFRRKSARPRLWRSDPVQPLPNEDTARLLDQANAAWTAQARSLRALPYIAGVLAAFIALISIGILRTGRVYAAPVLVITFVPFVLVMSNSLPIAASLLISALGGAYVLRNRLQTGLLFAGV